ncbi:MAG: beta-ketoacyl-ACP reductase [Acidimicrobiia bacterium]|nr:beta-ketoacyl-ACP reductase [Acidimicrobiia bacterium]
MGELDGRVALVTGGGRGIGRSVCDLLAREGADVAFGYRSDEAAAAETVGIIESYGRKALAINADMGDAQAVRQMVVTAREALGPITLLVNNAAYTHLLDHTQLTYERWQRFQRINVDGPYLTTWGVKDDMIAAGGGAIVNISSLSASSPRHDMIGYGASKGALNSFSRACAIAFVDLNIRVNTVAPGLVLTPRAETTSAEFLSEVTAAIPMRRGGQPVEVAEMVLFLLSDRASFITGELMVVAGGQH